MSEYEKLTVAELWERARELLPKIGEGAAHRESERIHPHDEIRALADSGLLTWRVPSEFGGPGATVAQAIEFITEVAAVDANIAQALRPGFGFVEGLVDGSHADPEPWYERVLARQVFGGAFGEIGAANGVIRARVVPDPENRERWVANGHKFYSTGALYADWVTVTAQDEEGTTYSFTIPSDRPGLRRVDDWDGIGQRLTASGSTFLEGVEVHPDELRTRADGDAANASEGDGESAADRSLVTPFQQLVLAATEVGIARNALADAIAYAKEKARPIKHSYASSTVEDPYVQHPVGEMSARTYAAEAAVQRAAAAIDAAHEIGTHEARVQAAIDVAQAQFIAVETGLKVAELLFDVGGGSTALRKYNFDRHWRNARTVANHNPRYYKAGIVGAYLLSGEEPPTTGLF